MKEKEIEILGKRVGMGYSYATEIAYKEMTGSDVHTYIRESCGPLSKQTMPDVQKTLSLITSSVTSYYARRDEESPIRMKDMLMDSSPLDISRCLSTFLELYAEFYHVARDASDSGGDPDDASDKKK